MFGIIKKLFGSKAPAEVAQAKVEEAPYKVETPAPKADVKAEVKAETKAKAPAKKAAPKKPAVVAKTGGKGRKPKAK